MRRVSLLFGYVIFTAIAAGQSAAERAAFIDQVRQQALAYNENLPNYICTQETRRSATSVKTGIDDWKPLDTFTIRLSYFDKHEDYRVVQVNGKPTGKTMKQLGGWNTYGDFGSMLHDVFKEKSQTNFEWDRQETWNGRTVAVLKYHIDRAHSDFHSTAHGLLHSSSTVWAVAGTIYADPETHQVMRLTVDSVDVPANVLLREFHIAMEYDFQRIGDREYLLPARSVSVLVSKSERRKSETRFTEYRKFSAEAAITFGGEAK
jgi:hypothetical protein